MIIAQIFVFLHQITQRMIKVSVILPIYNVAPYLDETFQSLLDQSLRDIEIIAVNDGSTDNSEEIIRKYQQLDSRIIHISQENRGLSGARNAALPYATGQYIYFMDSDDIISNSDALRICYEYAEKNQADFIFFDGKRFQDGSYKKLSNLSRTHLTEEDTKYDCLKQSFVDHRVRSSSIMGQRYSKRNLNCYLTVADELLRFRHTPIIHKFLRYTLSKVFYTGHLIPFKDKPAVFWRAMRSGYLKYIGIKSALVFWLK